jgi:ferric-dicitrate binding protein FerR (iron transport regulator)
MEQHDSSFSDIPDDLLLLQYVARTLPASEQERVARWLMGNPDGQARVDELAVVWRQSGTPSMPADCEQALLRVRRRIDAARSTAVQSLDDRAHGSAVAPVRGVSSGLAEPARGARWDDSLPGFRAAAWKHHGWRIAAALLVVIGLVGGLVGYPRWMKTNSATAPGQMLRYTTANGQRANVTLPDGSVVSLNVASRLDVPTDYMRGHRTLYLRGEALFAVTHHDRVPLTVVAGHTTTTVLGTHFVVRHYATDSLVRVAVHDGKVSVRSVVLTANEEATVGATGHVRVQPASAARFTFASGVLTLEDMPLSAGIVELSRWYDADIRLGDSSLAAQRIKGKFAAGSLADLTAILEWTFNVRVVRSGRVLTLYPRG